MNTVIERLNGLTYDLEALGITTVDFAVSSPVPRNNTEIINGRHGAIDLGTTYDPRPIAVSFYFKSEGYEDYALKRDEVFRLFRSKEPFYLIETRNPGKRWRVKIDRPFTPNQEWRYGFFTVDFIALTGFAESIGTSLEPRTLVDGLLTWGLPGELEDVQEPRFSSADFTLINYGDETVDPRFMPLLITFTGPSTNLKISNNTTGEEWAYTGTTTVSDTLRIDGPRSTKNLLSIFRNTNRKLISIVPGDNHFTITGATGVFTISFDYRYYYF